MEQSGHAAVLDGTTIRSPYMTFPDNRGIAYVRKLLNTDVSPYFRTAVSKTIDAALGFFELNRTMIKDAFQPTPSTTYAIEKPEDLVGLMLAQISTTTGDLLINICSNKDILGYDNAQRERAYRGMEFAVSKGHSAINPTDFYAANLERVLVPANYRSTGRG